MTTWREFWDSAHSIYVSDRHKDVHYRDVAEQLAAFVPRPARARARLRQRRGDPCRPRRAHARAKLCLCDAAASVRAAIAARFAGNPKIKVIAPEEVERLPDAVARSRSSRIRWCSTSRAAELDRMLALWRRLLAPGGVLIVADVIPPQCRRAERRPRAAALRRRERLSRRGAGRPHAHRALALSRACAASSASRATTRRNSSTSCAPPALRPSACRAMSSTIRRA